MRKPAKLVSLVCALLLLLSSVPAHARIFKWIKVGKYRDKIVDSADQESTAGEYTFAYTYFDGFATANYSSRGWGLNCKDFVDTLGVYHSIFQVNSSVWGVNELTQFMPVPGADGNTIHRYFREEPPTIVVDGHILNEPFPTPGDAVDPKYIETHGGGSALVMVESWINTPMGITVHQKGLAWAQEDHDDYIIWEMTLINTGNADTDPEIELPNQTIHELYFSRGFVLGPLREKWVWTGAYGPRPQDSLRVPMYTYAAWTNSPYDDFGRPDQGTGFLTNPLFVGEGVVHADKSPNDPSDDVVQPQMTGSLSCTSPGNWYRVKYGLNWDRGIPYIEDAYPGTHHTIPMEERGKKYPWDVIRPWRYGAIYSVGPYTLGPGDSVRIVMAQSIGTISPEKAWQVGKEWKEGNCKWDGPNILPPPAQQYPELVPSDNDYAKDCWVASGKDSLFHHIWAAKFCTDSNYEIAVPPPAPSVYVTSASDKIIVEWGDESERAGDFAGYRIYRALGSPYYSEEGGTVVGKWKLVKEIRGAGTHRWEDTSAERGKAYYYCVTAFDDGSQNKIALYPGKPLESGKYLSMTTRGATLLRAAGSLSKVRVVPNPFHVKATELQYPGQKDKIMFLGLPPRCTIKIFSESGDLIRTIEHTDGSGDEAWQNVTGEAFQTTETGQIVVSGIYIAHIETPDGQSANVKFVIVR